MRTPGETCGVPAVARSMPVVSGVDELHRPGRPVTGQEGG